MTSKYNSLIIKLQKALIDNSFWNELFAQQSKTQFTLHLAIFKEPYLQFIMDGQKTVESRFSKNQCAPYQKVADGDILLLKKSGGDIVGLCAVEKVWFYQLDLESLSFIRDKFGAAICPVDKTFWEEREQATYATLMRIGQVTAINGIHVEKRDRRGWVVFENPKQRSLLLI